MHKVYDNQEYVEQELAFDLTILMAKALETKNQELAQYIESIASALESIGFFADVKGAFLPFSTGYGAGSTYISDYINDELSGIVGLEDAASYDTKTKWGVPSVDDLTYHAMNVKSRQSRDDPFYGQANFDRLEKLDKAKAKKIHAERAVEEKQLNEAVEKRIKQLDNKLEEIKKLNKKNRS